MKNRSIILTAILSLLGGGGLSCTALAQGAPTASVNVVKRPNVNVVNTATNPVPVTGTVGDAENPARQAVQTTTQFTFTTITFAQTSITIPAGKIFVLEFVSFSVADPNPSTVAEFLQITVTGNLVQGGQGSAIYRMALPPNASTATGVGSGSGSQLMRLYAQPGTTLVIDIAVNAVITPRATVSLSGYFVNAQ